MRLGSIDHKFCWSLQFALWYNALVSQYKEEIAIIVSYHNESEFESEESNNVEKQPVWEIDVLPMHHTSTVCNRRWVTSTNIAGHTSVVETAIHLLQTVTMFGEQFSLADYRRHRKRTTNHTYRTKAMKNIPCVPPGKWLFRTEPKGSGKKVILRL